MVNPTDPIEFLAAPGSPYSRKMLALLRYRRIPHIVHWGTHRQPSPDYPEPKVKLLPTFYLKNTHGDREAIVDSTPLIRRFEAEYPSRSVLPVDASLGFLNDLIEDFADEWLTKAMFHYRWAYPADIKNAGPLLIFWSDPTLEHDVSRDMADTISTRQIDRLYVVGSNATTAQTIEASYERLVSILDRLIAHRGYVLGARPSAADFALYGQLTQLAIIDPTPAKLTQDLSPRLRAWLDRVDDLSGLTPTPEDWFDDEMTGDMLRPLLREIGRVYAPFLMANANAVMARTKEVNTEIDGRPWTQPVFSYQAKCLQALQSSYGKLPSEARRTVDGWLSGTGCEVLFAS